MATNESQGGSRASDAARPDRRTLAWTGAYLACWGGLALVTSLVGPPWRAHFAQAGVELPWITHTVLVAGDALRAGWGLVPLALGLALLVLPVWVVPGSGTLLTYLRLAVVQILLLGLCVWMSLELPFLSVHRMLLEDAGGPPDAHEQRSDLLFSVGRFVVPAALGVTLAQAGAWALLSRDALGLPRAAPGLEALRALMISLLPILILAPLTHGVLSGLRVDGHGGLIASPAVAAAGTVALVIYGGAFALRLRRGLQQEQLASRARPDRRDEAAP